MAATRGVAHWAFVLSVVAGASRLLPDALRTTLRTGVAPDWLPTAASLGTTVVQVGAVAPVVEFLAVPIGAFVLGVRAAGNLELATDYRRYLAALAVGGGLGVAAGTLVTGWLVFGAARGSALVLLLAWGIVPVVSLVVAGVTGTAVAEVLKVRPTDGTRLWLDPWVLVAATLLAALAGATTVAPRVASAVTTRPLSDYVVLTVWSLGDPVSGLQTVGATLAVVGPLVGGALLGLVAAHRLDLVRQGAVAVFSIVLGTTVGFALGARVPGVWFPVASPHSSGLTAVILTVGPPLRFTLSALAVAALSEIRRAESTAERPD